MSDVPPRDGPPGRPGPLAQAPPSPQTPMSSQAAAPPAVATDVVILGPPTADGAGLHVIRARSDVGTHRIETGELRPLQEGRPIVGEIVTLKPREANPQLCDVTDSFAPSAPHKAQLGHKGPAKVATQAYREGWDEIFGTKPTTPGPAN